MPKFYWERSLYYGDPKGHGPKRLDEAKWRYLNAGGYNTVYISIDNIRAGDYIGRFVFKKYNNGSHFLSSFDRAVRKWNTLNPTLPAYLGKNGWYAPYLGDECPTDEEIANQLLQYYRDDRTVIADAYIVDNFRKYKGKIYCIDMDFNLRRRSIATERQIEEGLEAMFEYLDVNRVFVPSTVLVTSAFLWLEICLPDEVIKSEYLSIEALTAIDLLRQRKVKLTKPMMEQLVLFIKHDPRNEIRVEGIVPLLSLQLKLDITPQLLAKLKPLIAEDPSVDDPYNGIEARHIPYLLQPERVISEGIIQKYTHAVHAAARFGLFEELKAMIEKSPLLAHVTDEHYQTPLTWAAASGHEDIVAYLLTHKVHLNPQTRLDRSDERFDENNELTPLDWSRRNHHSSITRLLAGAGARSFIDLRRRAPSINNGLLKHGLHREVLSEDPVLSEDHTHRPA